MKEYGSPISLAEAGKLSDAAEAEASANGWAMVIAVVDSSGHLVLLRRMDHAQFGSIEIAQEKARTAIDFKRPTKVFEEALEQGGLGLRLLSAQNLCPLEGGIPLVANERLIGAIGVSGGRSVDDGQVAAAGARTVSD